MGSRRTEIEDQPTGDSTPEDVAALYSWANLRGAKYRDYSASRREYRAQVRYRAARGLLERELRGQLEAEAAAVKAERAALELQPATDRHDDKETSASRIASVRSAEEAVRLASSERVEAARRAESAARAGVLALREEREIAEAHSSALRQALVYEESERRRRQLAGPQPYSPLAGKYPATIVEQNDLRGDGPETLQQFMRPGWRNSIETSFSPEAKTLAQKEGHSDPDPPRGTPESVFPGASAATPGPEVAEDDSTPAWLTSSQAPARSWTSQAILQSPKGESNGGDTLQDSRERVAAQWFALKAVFEHSGPELAARQPPRPANNKTPMLAVFSLAGGVGKTSLVATLGRALAAQGEKVTLVDTTSHGLLGIYFGSYGARPTAVASAPAATANANPAISLVVHDCADTAEDDLHRDTVTEGILRNGDGNHRLLLDLSTGSSWLIRRLVELHPTVLIPIAPDMNSVISLQAVERLFRGFVGSDGHALLPYYVLTQFDASLPLHLDVREVFRRQLGDRLLHIAIRRSPAVGEALADGMTVLDYAPDAAVSRDYRDIAAWLRRISPPATEESRHKRWGER